MQWFSPLLLKNLPIKFLDVFIITNFLINFHYSVLSSLNQNLQAIWVGESGICPICNIFQYVLTLKGLSSLYQWYASQVPPWNFCKRLEGNKSAKDRITNNFRSAWSKLLPEKKQKHFQLCFFNRVELLAVGFYFIMVSLLLPLNIFHTFF